MSDTNERSVASTGSVCEPVAWAVFTPDGFTRVLAFSRDDARIERKSASEQIAPLYRQPQPTLTDAEREAVEWCRNNVTAIAHPSSAFAHIHAAALRGLLERLK